jgi:tetratricopeptide (TPR) repeat protein
MMRVMTILRVVAVACMLAALAGCTPQQALMSSLLPDGTTSVLLSHFQAEEEGNRKQVAALEGRKDWDGLVKLAEENLKQDRRSASWWFVAGYAHSQAGRHLKAAECFNELALLAPDDIENWEMLAQELLASGQSQKAVQTLSNALRMRDDSPTAWLLLGRGYEDLARPDLAAGAYRAAIKLDGNLAQAWFGLGRASVRLDRRADFEQALKALEKLKSPLAQQLAEMGPSTR